MNADTQRSRSSARIWSIVALLSTATALAFGLWIKSHPTFSHDEERLLTAIGHSGHPLKGFSKILQTLFSVQVSIGIVILLILATLLVTKSPLETLYSACTIVVPIAVVTIIKVVVSRPRPFFNTHPELNSWSFPSGHAAGSTVITLALIALIGQWAANYHIKHSMRLLQIVLCVIPLLTAYSRLILKVHYPSDVITSLILCPILYFTTRKLLNAYRPGSRLFNTPNTTHNNLGPVEAR